MKLKGIACLLFFLNTILFATYYSVAKEALGRIDPIIFSFFEMVLLSPVALCILALSWNSVNREVVKRGVLLGSWLCLSLFTIAIALKYSTATSTAFFPALNGLLAALIAWLFLRQPIKKITWFAGTISVIGTILLIANSQMGGWRGTLIAFLGGIFFTGYVFLSDHEQKDNVSPWALFGVETLTTAIWAGLIALLFGDWQAVHPSIPKDVGIILYISGAATFLPILITVFMQKYISPVTVSFIYILEPVLGAVMANLYLHEMLPWQGYLGGGLVVVGTIVHTAGVSISKSPAKEKAHRKAPQKQAHPAYIPLSPAAPATPATPATPASRTAMKGLFIYPLLFAAIGYFFIYGLGGFPPHAWLVLYRFWPYLSSLMQQGQQTFVVFLLLQSFCWLIAWIAYIILGLLTAIYVARALIVTSQKPNLHQNYYPLLVSD